jgi:holo-[acyl-carrier protein] synthase
MTALEIALGTDIVHISALAQLIADRSSAFVEQTFTASELAYAQSATSGSPAQHLAARFAAKEATLKALDHAAAMRQVVPPSVALNEIEVARDERGRPYLTLHKSAGALADQLSVMRAQVSLSHDGDYAVAYVQIALASASE